MCEARGARRGVWCIMGGYALMLGDACLFWVGRRLRKTRDTKYPMEIELEGALWSWLRWSSHTECWSVINTTATDGRT